MLRTYILPFAPFHLATEYHCVYERHVGTAAVTLLEEEKKVLPVVSRIYSTTVSLFVVRRLHVRSYVVDSVGCEIPIGYIYSRQARQRKSGPSA